MAGDARKLVDALGLTSQAVFKLNMLRVSQLNCTGPVYCYAHL